MASRISAVICALSLLGCGAATDRWTPPEDVRADSAVVFLSSECTAVVVGARVALTAAHCVEARGPYALRIGRRDVPVDRCAVHPGAYPEPRDCGAGDGRTTVAHDLAVLFLAEPAGVEPVEVLLAPPAPFERWWVRHPVRVVGWDRRPRVVGYLARRDGHNRIARMGSETFVTVPERRDGFAPVIGDSGGPALLRISGEERVAGVLRGTPAYGSRASLFAATFAPENARWLLRTLPRELATDLSFDELEPFGEPERPGVSASLH